MRIEAKFDLGGTGVTPRSLYWNELRIDIIEIIDQWYGADYRCVKVKDDDGGLYVLRFDERRNEVGAHHVRLGTRPDASDANRMIPLNDLARSAHAYQ